MRNRHNAFNTKLDLVNLIFQIICWHFNVFIEAIVPKLEFRVKFYPSDVCSTISLLNEPYDFAPTERYAYVIDAEQPTSLNETVTKYLITCQVRMDIITGKYAFGFSISICLQQFAYFSLVVPAARASLSRRSLQLVALIRSNWHWHAFPARACLCLPCVHSGFVYYSGLTQYYSTRATPKLYSLSLCNRQLFSD